MPLFEMMRRFRSRTGHFDSETAAYRRVVGQGYAPDALIDVGAYEGHWTCNARKVFGNVPTVMIEPQKSKLARLTALADTLPGTSVVSEVLSSSAGKTVTFYEMETGSSLMPERSDAERREVVLKTNTLDAVAPPYENIFLKIDAQGAELEILAGGEATLARSSLVQLEAAIAQYNEGAPSLIDVLGFMDDRCFTLLDIAGYSRIQDHLVQVDLLFVPRGSSLKRSFFRFS